MKEKIENIIAAIAVILIGILSYMSSEFVRNKLEEFRNRNTNLSYVQEEINEFEEDSNPNRVKIYIKLEDGNLL